MISRIDYRTRPRTVTLTMTLAEFREHVEWLLELAPSDGATRAWDDELNRIDPAPNGCAERGVAS